MAETCLYLEEDGRQDMRIDENTALFLGIGMLAVAGLISLSTYISAGPADGYIVTMGLFLAGGISLIRGLYLHLKYGSRT